MRLHLEILSEKKTIPFNHQHLLVGAIYKWLGVNNEHGEVSMFSFSRLTNGKVNNEGLIFERGSNFFISSQDSDFIKKLIIGIQKDPSLFEGLSVKEIIIEEDPDLSKRELFYVASPIFIKRRVDSEIKYYFFNDEVASQFLKETLQTKMNKVGMIDDTLDICFDKNFVKPQIKKINYKGVDNKASWCNVIIKGKPETKLFAWNVGLGNSTGIGFGAIK